MRLVTYTTTGSDGPFFGVVVDDSVFSFSALQREAGVDCKQLASMRAFVAAPLPARAAADELVEFARTINHEGSGRLAPHEHLRLSRARLLPPLIPPAALFDFALSPRHLQNAAQTMVTYEFSGLKRFIARRVVRRKIERAQESRELPYYIGNHHAVTGDDDAAAWPSYTSYLDIEPELALVTGPPDTPIAGYTILNDLSARDIQMPELDTFSLTRSKHFDRSNGLGPYLVTPDEVGDPLSLNVTVRIGNRYHWRGSTSEYSIRPTEALEYLYSIFSPAPGSVIGLGTIPDCCCLDNDQWLLPGDVVEINFDKLGTLRQRIPKPTAPLLRSRWAERDELQSSHQP